MLLTAKVRRPLPGGPLFAIAMMTACGGGNAKNTGFTALDPELVVAPETVDFGGVVVLYSETETVQLLNTGRDELEISALNVTGDDDGIFGLTVDAELDENGLYVLEPGDSLSAEISFAPEKYINYTRSLRVTSNDPEKPDRYIPITGSGVDGPVPDIAIEALSLDFGLVTVGSPRNLTLDIENEGDGELSLDNVSIDPAGPFTIASAGSSTIAGESSTTWIVQYAPTADGGDNARLVIQSNDPDEPEVSVALLGNGGGDFAYPDARIDCPSGPVRPPILVPMDGRRSSDPNGYAITSYEWTVQERPGGSGAYLQDPFADYTQLFADISGSYEVQLVVENEIGLRSEPASCSFEAVPQKSVHIEMFWDVPNSDVDLHLVQYGYGLFELPGDCNYCNPNPNWGADGEAGDPLLALDNRAGYGPENINMDSPGNGDYDVFVHYFDDKGGGTAVVTVKVWVNGALEWEGSQALTDNQLWQVGFLRWPDGIFTDLGGSPTRATRNTCWEAE